MSGDPINTICFFKRLKFCLLTGTQNKLLFFTQKDFWYISLSFESDIFVLVMNLDRLFLLAVAHNIAFHEDICVLSEAADVKLTWVKAAVFQSTKW